MEGSTMGTMPRAYMKIWRFENIKKIRAQRSRWAKNNRPKINAYLKKWRERNQDKVMAIQLKFLSKHPFCSMFPAFRSLDSIPGYEASIMIDRITPLDELIMKEEGLL
jgi:hypothetical protein